MASSTVMASSSNSINSDLQQHRTFSSSSSTKLQSSLADQTNNHNNNSYNSNSSMTVDGLLRNVYGTNPNPDSTLLDAQITFIDTSLAPISGVGDCGLLNSGGISSSIAPKTVDDVWREIVAGDRKECKEEAPDEMMTLEDFLARAGAASAEEEEDVKVVPPPPLTERLSSDFFTFDPNPPSPLQALDKVEGSIIGFGNGIDLMGSGGETPRLGGIRVGGRGKRGRALEPLDKAAQQRQRRMIKNRESAARSRERKQAYQVELETLAVRLEEENARLLQEMEERTKERYKQLMEKIIPIEEKQRPKPALRRVRSLQW